MREAVGREVADALEQMTRAVYAHGETKTRERGIIVADTKFGFGRDRDGHMILIDEVVTPELHRASGRSTPAGPAATELRQAAAA